MNILLICTGNTCRSPMAEALLADKKLANIAVKSRGLCADGSPAAENAQAVCAEWGIDLTAHRSATCTAADCTWADKILCLSAHHRAALLQAGISPEKPVVLGSGIADPFGQDVSVYRHCRDEIAAALDALCADGFFTPYHLTDAAEHLSGLADLERECFAEPWSENALRESLNAGTVFLTAADVTGRIIGYLGVQIVLDEGYITNVAVTESQRCKGVGHYLLAALISLCRKRQLAFVSLEVRPSNQAALALYEAFGFAAEGRRKNFYRAPVEDALILTKRFVRKDENIKY